MKICLKNEKKIKEPKLFLKMLIYTQSKREMMSFILNER